MESKELGGGSDKPGQITPPKRSRGKTCFIGLHPLPIYSLTKSLYLVAPTTRSTAPSSNSLKNMTFATLSTNLITVSITVKLNMLVPFFFNH